MALAGIRQHPLLGVSLVRRHLSLRSCPLVGLGWAIAQAWSFVLTAHPIRRTTAILRRRAGRFFLRVPNFRSEAAVLAGSGFMGEFAVGEALPAAGLAPFIAPTCRRSLSHCWCQSF